MGYYKNKEIESLERQETEVPCENCDDGTCLTKAELELAKIDGMYLCSYCREKWEKIEKE